MPGHVFVDEERLTDTILNDKEIRVVNGALAESGINAKIGSWQNTVVSGTILVHMILVYITTPSTAAAKLNAGHAATEIASDDMIDGAALDAAAGTVINSAFQAGTGNALGAVRVEDDEWVTFFEDNSADPADLVGEYYIFYTTS